MTTKLPQVGVASAMPAAVVGRLILANVVWVATALGVWVCGALIWGGVAAFLAVASIALVGGPVLVGVASGVHVLMSRLLGQRIPSLIRDVLSALSGWALALAVWGAVIWGGVERPAVTASVIVACVGAALGVVIVRRGPAW